MTDYKQRIDAQILADSIRALQREMTGGFAAITRALTALDRIEDRIAALAEQQSAIDKRLAEHEQRIAALEAKRRKPTKKRA